jgi:hypothetical protein
MPIKMDTDLGPGKNGCLYILCDTEVFYHNFVVVIEIMFTFDPSEGSSPTEGPAQVVASRRDS